MKKIFYTIISSILILALVLTGCTTPKKKPIKKPVPRRPAASSTFEKGRVERIKIAVNNATYRSGNSNTSPIITTLPKGNVYNVVGESKDKYVVETENGQVGTVDPSQAQPYIEAPSLENQTENMQKLTPNEEEMVRLVNEERTKNNLKPLKVDMELTKLARLKSQDMIDKNYFSHNSPTYGNPFDMMKKFGVKYIYAGENIAGNQSVKNAHQSLMNSEGHRKNILNPNFTHIGKGFVTIHL